MASPVQAVSSLYGGFWNFELQDFCYMTNRYFPPADLIGELASSLPELVKSYPSTNRHLSSLVAAPLGLTHEQVVVGNGAAEIISVLSGLRVERLAVPIPTFDEYPNRAAVQGKPVSRYPTDAEFVLDVDGFIAHVAETGANAVVLIRPNNPSGTLIPKSSVVDMLQAFRRLDLVVIDESFLYFASPDWPQLSALSLIHEFPNLVIVNSMSKAYGVPGLRLGYAVSGDDALVARLRAELPIWSVNSLAPRRRPITRPWIPEPELRCLLYSSGESFPVGLRPLCSRGGGLTEPGCRIRGGRLLLDARGRRIRTWLL